MEHLRHTAVKKGFTAFSENDVLFAKITPCMENGKMAIVPRLISGIGFGSTEFHVLKPCENVNSKYLYYYVSSGIFRADAEHNMTGAVGQKRVSTNYLKVSEIPITSLDEQAQVVLEIENKISVVDQLELTIATSLQQSEALRQSILKKAFSGTLVAQDANDEPASVLLARIKSEKQQLNKGKVK